LKVINYTFLRFTLFLVLGILSAKYFNFRSFYFLKALPFCCILLLFITWHERKQLKKNILFGVVAYISFYVLGVGTYQSQLATFKPQHYSHYYTKNDIVVSEIQIKEVLRANNYYKKYIGKITYINSKKVAGKLLLSIKNDSITPSYEVDDVLLITAKIGEISKPLNPHQFNYKNYLENLGVLHQLRISQSQVVKAKIAPKRTLRGYAENIRNKVIKKLKETPTEDSQRSILQALVLGQRNDISKEVKNKYAAAGAMHILAVSGLHVGILFWLINGLLKPLYVFKHGKIYSQLILIILLWGFAVFSGLSPSVVRAVTMFSFFTFSGVLNRLSNVFNTLCLSFFFLILLNPNWLFDIGFQLSYLAVFFIIWAPPKLFGLYRPKHFIIKNLWSIFTVTIAAQIGVAPLGIYYFHQFPGLFFITNIVILPFISLLLVGGILIVILACCNLHWQPIYTIYNRLLELLNQFISWVAKQDTFIFKDLSISKTELFIVYFLICIFLFWWQKKRVKYIWYATISIWLLISHTLWNNYFLASETLVLFHIPKKSVLGHVKNSELKIFKNDSLDYTDIHPIKSFKIKEKVSTITNKVLKNTYRFNNKTILRLDSTGVYPNKKVAILLLTYNSKIHLEKVINQLQPEQVIADGSNYKSYIQRWRETCSKQNIPFYYTGENGAYLFKI